MVNFIFALLIGYAVSIYTWPWLRTKFNGVETEISILKVRVIALEEKIKAKL